MKTDSLFFQIFQTSPGLLFELLGEDFALGANYEFRAEEVKQTAFRVDGVFVPKPRNPQQAHIFVEVQFQLDPRLYDRLFAEISLYIAQNPDLRDWLAVVIFARHSMEPLNQVRHRSLLQGEQVRVIYLEDFLAVSTERLGIQLMQLIVASPNNTEKYLRPIVQRFQNRTDQSDQAIIDLVSTVIVYKFPHLSREEIEAMFSISELKQTKVYQEALDEGLEQGLEQGRLAGELALLVRQLEYRFGIAPEIKEQLKQLSSSKLEMLGQAIFNFRELADLEQWLTEHQGK